MATYQASLLEENVNRIDYKLAIILSIPAVLSSYLIEYSCIMGLQSQNKQEDGKAQSYWRSFIKFSNYTITGVFMTVFPMQILEIGKFFGMTSSAVFCCCSG